MAITYLSLLAIPGLSSVLGKLRTCLFAPITYFQRSKKAIPAYLFRPAPGYLLILAGGTLFSTSSRAMKKVKVIIEVELTEHTHIPAAMLAEQLSYSRQPFPAAPESPGDALHMQALLEALQADAARYREFVRTVVVGSLEVLGVNNLLTSLAQLRSPYDASLTVLEELIPQLPPASQHYFQRAEQEGWLSESTEGIFCAIQARPLTLRVETAD